MFEDEYKKANNRLHRSAEADAKVLDAIKSAGASACRTHRSFSKGAMAAVAAVLCVLIIAPAVIGITNLALNQKSSRSNNGSKGIIALVFAGKSFESSSGSVTAADYADVYDRLNKNMSPYIGSYIFGGFLADYAMVSDGDFYYEAAQAPTSADSASPNTDHSDTNVQVEGVDEADIIKTDGEHIFVLNSKGVTILKAAGAQTEQLSFISAEDMPTHHEDAYTCFVSMYINGGKLIVIATERVAGSFYDIPESIIDEAVEVYRYRYYGWRGGSYVTTVYVYSVENASEPKLLNTLCMDGSYKDSRLTDGKLYLITNYWPGGMIVYDAPCTYIPCMFNDKGDCILTSAEDIYVTDNSNDSESYTYIGALDLNSTESFSGTLAILGNINTVYCSKDNLYLASFEYKSEETDIRFINNDKTGEPEIVENGGKSGKLYTNTEYTGVYKIRLGSQPVLESNCRIEGRLLNQFSMDEHNGYLRVVADRDTYCYIESGFGDGDYADYVGYSYTSNTVDDNALYVLDSNLKTVGMIEDIGVNEHVKSVRFMGDVGYVVTFRQTDPLFSIDLSDPAHPSIIGELHIPGFSEYLHSWNGDLLFGIGQMADEHTGGTEGLKLTMFDVSDNSDVKQLYSHKVNNVEYSAAEYNHKLILVSPERGIIGFPAMSYDKSYSCNFGYCVYTFDESKGFTERAYIKLDSSYDYLYADMTGMYIGDYFYIILPDGDNESSQVRIFVVDLNTFEVVDTPVFNN